MIARKIDDNSIIRLLCLLLLVTIQMCVKQ